LSKLLKILVVLTIVTAACGPVSAAVKDSIFAAANDSYQNKDYEAALESYLKLSENGYESAPLFYNMGNCFFKTGRPGYAILYYLKAQTLDPFDEDIANNLTFARQFMPTRLEGVQINPVSTFMGTLTEPFSLNNLAWISSGLFILFLICLSWKIYSGGGGLAIKVILYSLLVLVIISSGLTTYEYRTDYKVKKGVIVADETRIYSGPGEDNDVEFVGGFGLEFEVESETPDYYLVLFENKRKGWILKSDVELI